MTGLAFLAMGVLAVVETGAYWQSGYRSTVFMDKDLNGQVRINFNITMHDLSCDYATIDLVKKTIKKGLSWEHAHTLIN